MFAASEGSGRLPNKCYHHNLGLPLIGGGIFRRAPSAVRNRKWPGIVCVDAHQTTSVACLMMSGCLHTSQETRVSGSQALLSIKGGARTCYPDYWATSDGEISRGFPLATIFGALQGCFELRQKPQYPS